MMYSVHTDGGEKKCYSVHTDVKEMKLCTVFIQMAGKGNDVQCS